MSRQVSLLVGRIEIGPALEKSSGFSADSAAEERAWEALWAALVRVSRSGAPKQRSAARLATAETGCGGVRTGRLEAWSSSIACTEAVSANLEQLAADLAENARDLEGRLLAAL